MPTPPARTPLRMSADRRYLVDADGRPFFFLADTNWTIVWKGEPEQWSTFLNLRQKLGFSVLQVNLHLLPPGKRPEEEACFRCRSASGGPTAPPAGRVGGDRAYRTPRGHPRVRGVQGRRRR